MNNIRREIIQNFSNLLSGFNAVYNLKRIEELIQLASRQQKFIQGLEAALIRIKNKTYGIDRITGKLIPKERLRAVPHATLSVESKNARHNH